MRVRLIASLCAGLTALVMLAPAAGAYEWPRRLRAGDQGKAVKALQMRIAGWYAQGGQEEFVLDGAFGQQTRSAVRAFQKHYDLRKTGVARRSTFKVIERLTSKDGSTAHFDYSEFEQNRSEHCSAKANAYAGTFGGGMSAPRIVKRNARRLMWRLEALRAKSGGEPIGISSGFRSITYNDCIGGARASQHLYGTAADNRMAHTSNKHERAVARHSQFHGIGCYSRLSHNHFDLRLENDDNPEAAFWWWPERDRKGRDLDFAGKPCWGQAGARRPATTSRTTTTWVVGAIRALIPGAGSLLPSVEEIKLFSETGEPLDLGPGD